MFRVVAMSAWPRICLTTSGGRPLAAILVAVVIYGVLVIVLRAITKEDLALMPKGEKIARILHLS